MPQTLRQWREGTSQQGWYESLAVTMSRLASRARPEVRSVVDIGAGGLELTRALASVFPAAQIEAWDLFADDSLRSHPERVTLHSVDLNQVDRVDPGRRFEIVACVAVLEHVLDPLALLRLVQSVTAPGGLAFVVAPDVGSIAHRLLGRHWPYYCVDEHLTLPSIASIRRALDLLRRETGIDGEFTLRRVSVRYSLQYLLRFLRVPLPLPRIADLLVPVPSGALELVWRRGQR
jgi:SAM-dependent methyltransferase